LKKAAEVHYDDSGRYSCQHDDNYVCHLSRREGSVIDTEVSVQIKEEVLSVSVENLKKYGKLCEEKEDVRKKAKEIGLQDLDGQIAYGKSLGMEFSKEDFAVLAKEAGVEKKDELSEEDLKKVAGGFATTTLLVGAAVASAVVGGAAGAAGANQPGW
jgi:lactobin A/cerein 7B family class IIb bacteriocin